MNKIKNFKNITEDNTKRRDNEDYPLPHLSASPRAVRSRAVNPSFDYYSRQDLAARLPSDVKLVSRGGGL